MGRGQGSSKGNNQTTSKGAEPRNKISGKNEAFISDLKAYVSSLYSDVDMLEGELEANGIDHPNKEGMTYYKKLNRTGTEEEQIASLNEFIDSLFKDVDMLEGELEANGLDNPNKSNMTYYQKRPRSKDYPGPKEHMFDVEGRLEAVIAAKAKADSNEQV